ncbi:hypothetical protein EDD85DRAFT_230038 [Armillaria nabsnona]|nr:hypothetical protein EDD85DRAFT_230038 [Armillaria nabsnona]
MTASFAPLHSTWVPIHLYFCFYSMADDLHSPEKTTRKAIREGLNQQVFSSPHNCRAYSSHFIMLTRISVSALLALPLLASAGVIPVVLPRDDITGRQALPAPPAPPAVPVLPVLADRQLPALPIPLPALPAPPAFLAPPAPPAFPAIPGLPLSILPLPGLPTLPRDESGITDRQLPALPIPLPALPAPPAFLAPPAFPAVPAIPGLPLSILPLPGLPTLPRDESGLTDRQLPALPIPLPAFPAPPAFPAVPTIPGLPLSFLPLPGLPTLPRDEASVITGRQVVTGSPVISPVLPRGQ